MFNVLKSIFSQDIRDEREFLTFVRMLRTILVIEIIGIIGLFVSDELSYHNLRTFYASAPLAILLIGCLWLLGRRILYPAQLFIPLGALLVRDYLALEGVGIHDISIVAFAVVIILAYLTLNKTLAIVFTGLTVLSTSLIALGEMSGALVNDYSKTTNLDDLVVTAILLIAISAVMNLIIDRLNETIRLSRQNEQKQIEANKELQEERMMLEDRVKERTADLERRAVQLRAAAEVGNAAAASKDLDLLLSEGTRLLSMRFGFYHVGIFLKDETGKYAILRASNSEGGERMLKRGHQLEIGQVGIVGYVTESGRARIALDVGKDAVYFDNPDLPQTRSEMALPLKVADRVLGALDIQSTESQAFKQDDLEVLQVVADQLAVAIENSRLLAESRAAVETVRRAYGEVSLQAWKRRLESNALAFKSDERGNVIETGSEHWAAEEEQAIREGMLTKSKNEKTLYVPMLQRGQAIGIIKLVKHDQSRWSDTEVQNARSLASQLSDSLETARLYDEAQNRAQRERTIAEVSTKISSVYNIDDILRSMTEELGKMFDDSEVVVQLTNKEDNHV